MKPWRLFFIFIASLISGFLLNEACMSLTNTLYYNGKWRSTKMLLKKGVMGANGFYFSRNSLRGGHLDLSSWWGYQEVIYKKPIVPKEISFDFLLTKDSYVIFEFNNNEERFFGIRISTHKKFNNVYFLCSDEGRFIFADQLEIPPLKLNKWNQAKITFGSNEVSFYLNRQFIKTMKIPLLAQQLFGFRGGKNKALIKNIAIYENSPSRVIRESFSNKNYWIGFILTFGIIAVFNYFVWLSGFLIRDSGENHRFKAIITINLTLIIIVSLFLLLDYFFISKRHLIFGGRKALKIAESKYWASSDPKSISNLIQGKYIVEPPKKDTIRILFIGTSQTWGAGARNETEAFVNIIEKKLNVNIGTGKHFECINAGVSGSNISTLFELYKDKWLILKPRLVVLILSNNDKDKPVFCDMLRSFVNLNSSKNIKTIFVLEANSIEEHQGELLLHKFMRQVAAESNIPLIDLHSYLLQNYDKGFLWWDYIHLTSFGQKLTADFLFERICSEIASL